MRSILTWCLVFTRYERASWSHELNEKQCLGSEQSTLKSSSVSSECGLLETSVPLFPVACHMVGTGVLSAPGELNWTSFLFFLFSFALIRRDLSSSACVLHHFPSHFSEGPCQSSLTCTLSLLHHSTTELFDSL